MSRSNRDTLSCFARSWLIDSSLAVFFDTENLADDLTSTLIDAWLVTYPTTNSIITSKATEKLLDVAFYQLRKYLRPLRPLVTNGVKLARICRFGELCSVESLLRLCYDPSGIVTDFTNSYRDVESFSAGPFPSLIYQEPRS